LKLNRRDWGFIAAAVLVVGVLVALSMVGKSPSPMNAGPHHAGLSVASKRTDCMVCHDPKNPNATHPLTASHPLVWRKEDVSCVVCHEPPATAVSFVRQARRSSASGFSSPAQFCFASR
jgi:hypothetical protein